MAHPLAQAAAQRLFDQHAAGAAFDGIAPAPDAPDEAFAYDVQAAYLALRTAAAPDKIGGYKIGLTTPRMQALCNGDRPISGVVFAGTILAAPATVSARAFVRLGIESELAVRIGSSLPAGGAPYTRADIANGITDIACAFELIEDRGADYASLNWMWLAADNSWNAGLILGQPVAPRPIDDLEGVLQIDGVAVDRGSTRDVLGHPYDAVAWLANHLASRGQELKPGQWVSTGSIANIQFAEPGRCYRFTIAGLPPVELAVGA